MSESDPKTTKRFFALAELLNIAREWDGLPPLHPADAVSHPSHLLEEYGEDADEKQ